MVSLFTGVDAVDMTVFTSRKIEKSYIDTKFGKIPVICDPARTDGVIYIVRNSKEEIMFDGLQVLGGLGNSLGNFFGQSLSQGDNSLNYLKESLKEENGVTKCSKFLNKEIKGESNDDYKRM